MKRAHEIFSRGGWRKATHAQYLEWLSDCIRRWEERGCPDMAKSVQRRLAYAKRQGEKRCLVCKA